MINIQREKVNSDDRHFVASISRVVDGRMIYDRERAEAYMRERWGEEGFTMAQRWYYAFRRRLDWEKGRCEREVLRAVMRSIVEMYGSDVAGMPAGLEELVVSQEETKVC